VSGPSPLCSTHNQLPLSHQMGWIFTCEEHPRRLAFSQNACHVPTPSHRIMLKELGTVRIATLTPSRMKIWRLQNEAVEDQGQHSIVPGITRSFALPEDLHLEHVHGPRHQTKNSWCDRSSAGLSPCIGTPWLRTRHEAPQPITTCLDPIPSPPRP
jgi:hypothetical protein